MSKSVAENESCVLREKSTKPAYTITSTGNVVVNVDRLLNDPRARTVAERARAIVRRDQGKSSAK